MYRGVIIYGRVLYYMFCSFRARSTDQLRDILEVGVRSAVFNYLYMCAAFLFDAPFLFHIMTPIFQADMRLPFSRRKCVSTEVCSALLRLAPLIVLTLRLLSTATSLCTAWKRLIMCEIGRMERLSIEHICFQAQVFAPYIIIIVIIM